MSSLAASLFCKVSQDQIYLLAEFGTPFPGGALGNDLLLSIEF